MRTIEHGWEVWLLHDDGAIERPRLVAPNASTWRVVGAATRDNFGNVVQWWSLEQILTNPGGIPWKFKNGKQRTFVQDMDHGTRREWRSPGHRVY